ncbi:MAG: hypothetical protein WCS65_02085 [Verrucomicrobiae bacterium]
MLERHKISLLGRGLVLPAAFVLFAAWSSGSEAILEVEKPPAQVPGPVVVMKGRAGPCGSIEVRVNKEVKEVFQAGEDGAFSHPVLLAPGKNEVSLTLLEAIPDGGEGYISDFNPPKPSESGPMRPSGGFRNHSYKDGICTTYCDYQEKPPMQVAIFGPPPPGANVLEMRVRNATAYKKAAIGISVGNAPDPNVSAKVVEVPIPCFMQDFAIMRWDLAKLAGRNPGDDLGFTWGPAPPVKRFDAIVRGEADGVRQPYGYHYYGEGPVFGTHEPIYLDYIKFYRGDVAAAGGLPTSTFQILCQSAASLSGQVDAMAAKLEAIRSAPKDPKAWAKAFSSCDRARIAARANDAAQAERHFEEATKAAAPLGL